MKAETTAVSILLKSDLLSRSQHGVEKYVVDCGHEGQNTTTMALEPGVAVASIPNQLDCLDVAIE